MPNHITDANKKKLLGFLGSRAAAGEGSLKTWGQQQSPRLPGTMVEEIADALVEAGLATKESRASGWVWRAVARRPEPPPIEVTTRETPGKMAPVEAPTPTENDVELSEEAEVVARPAPPKVVGPGSLPVVKIDPDEGGEPQAQASEPAPTPGPLSPLAQQIRALIAHGVCLPRAIDKKIDASRSARLAAIRELLASGEIQRLGSRKTTTYCLVETTLPTPPPAAPAGEPRPRPRPRAQAPAEPVDLDGELLARCLAMTPDRRAAFIEAWERALLARKEKVESARREQEAVAVMIDALGRRAA
jgi:hypothetical protein